LSDCLDIQEKYEGSHLLKPLAKTAMLMYFWDGQTGSGLITKHSKYETLKKNTNNSKIFNFIEAVESNIKLLYEGASISEDVPKINEGHFYIHPHDTRPIKLEK